VQRRRYTIKANDKEQRTIEKYKYGIECSNYIATLVENTHYIIVHWVNFDLDRGALYRLLLLLLLLILLLLYNWGMFVCGLLFNKRKNKREIESTENEKNDSKMYIGMLVSLLISLHPLIVVISKW